MKILITNKEKQLETIILRMENLEKEILSLKTPLETTKSVVLEHNTLENISLDVSLTNIPQLDGIFPSTMRPEVEENISPEVRSQSPGRRSMSANMVFQFRCDHCNFSSNRKDPLIGHKSKKHKKIKSNSSKKTNFNHVT